MAKRYELPDEGWELIADLVSKRQNMGRPRRDDRLMLNGISGYCARELHGETCLSDLALGLLSINAFAIGETTVHLLGFLNGFIFA